MSSNQKLRDAAMKVFPKSAKVIQEHAETTEYYAFTKDKEKIRMQVTLMQDGLVYRMQEKERKKRFKENVKAFEDELKKAQEIAKFNSENF